LLCTSANRLFLMFTIYINFVDLFWVKCFVAFEGRNGWKTLEVPNPELTDVNLRMKRQSAKWNLESSQSGNDTEHAGYKWKL